MAGAACPDCGGHEGEIIGTDCGMTDEGKAIVLGVLGCPCGAKWTRSVTWDFQELSMVLRMWDRARATR